MRLLSKNLDRVMPESVFRKELVSLGIRDQGFMQLRSGRLDQDLTMTALPHPTSLYQWRKGLRCPRCDQSTNFAACAFRCSRTWLQRTLYNASAANASDTRSEPAGTRFVASRVGLHLSGV